MDTREQRPPSSVSPTQSHDGYIRPLTPPRPPNSSVDQRSRSPLSVVPERPVIYRSSTTIFTKDKHQYVNGGEIRTWSVREGNLDDEQTRSYPRPSSGIHVERLIHQEVPSNTRDDSLRARYQTNDRDYRYEERSSGVQQYAYEQRQSSGKESPRRTLLHVRSRFFLEKTASFASSMIERDRIPPPWKETEYMHGNNLVYLWWKEQQKIFVCFDTFIYLFEYKHTYMHLVQITISFHLNASCSIQPYNYAKNVECFEKPASLSPLSHSCNCFLSIHSRASE